ncbi:MAG: glyceraldehyde-3-phosphate dehydrogenase [Bacteroidetes bacterium]|nr:glyceraldehyde-3-phosphate dehydrogenase [Bacteroidota bacterium]MBU1581018.1 glyceraldehyde-3-phosphate dehydrogenase [Bacteroidota bacterium]MBU2466894.1 glyceraldehyde-3-phosphate dehydrogenase [Bacteroidota bacterium]MBU2559010.1 glyceraldehyde-3-phosphate dehydrogenase [Bacteroidota bacterium]
MEKFNASLKSWIDNEKAATEFIGVVSKLWFDKSIELILLRSVLVNRGSGKILNKHIRAETILKKPVRVQDSLLIANAILEEEIAPARIDIGRLNAEWTEEQGKYPSVNAFVLDKLQAFVKAPPRSDKTQDVVLYGFGRIGRLLARELTQFAGNGSHLRLRAIVTRSNSTEDIKKRVSLFRKDSVHGTFAGVANEDFDNKAMVVNGQIIKFMAANKPEDIDYEAEGIQDALIIDNTGVFRDREELGRHLKAKGAAKVLLTAPGKGDIPNIVYGVNQGDLDLDSETIFSAASCTTNAIVPGLEIMEEAFGIIKGHIETIHAYTNDQNLLDNYHKKSRRGRSAPLNMVITETGAGSAAAKAIPSLKGKLTSNAVRVPVPNVSLAILTLEVEKPTSAEEVNKLFLDATLKGHLIEQIRFSNSTEFVSSDGIGDSCACIFDSPATKVSDDGKSVIVYLWYDNEFGYTSQVVRLARHIGKVKSYRYY